VRQLTCFRKDNVKTPNTKIKQFTICNARAWSSGERLKSFSKEATIDYVPVKREDRLIRVPIVKSAAGADLAIITDSERNIYREIEKDMKEESESRRDHW
jgi:hypothetical protein